MKKLSVVEKVSLKRRHRGERDKRICDRIKAVLAYDEGHTYSEIARWLLLDDETIRHYVADYHQRQKLKPENKGSHSELSDAQTLQLIRHLQKVTYLSVKAICAYVKRTFQVKYSRSGMTRWLQHHRFHYKKPQGVPAKANQFEQLAFVAAYETLKKKAPQEPIYFMDSVHPHHQTRLTYGWIYEGVRKKVPMTGKQTVVNYTAALCLDTMKLVYSEEKKVNQFSIQRFLTHLRKQHPQKGPLHLILDNAGSHHAQSVRDLAANLNIQLHYLPPHSPNLNPIERVWKWLHELVSANHYYETFPKFTEAIRNAFQVMQQKKIKLRQKINDRFHILNSPLFE